MIEPQIFAVREVHTWHVVTLAGEHLGGGLKREADRLKAKVRAELAQRLPEHEIDEHAFLLEIGVQYYAR